MPIYGLSDASRQWYLKVKQELLSLGFKQLKVDNAVFSWFENGCLHGLVACHVDDFVYAGSELFHAQVVTKLRSSFIIGKEEKYCFKFLGIFLECQPSCIRISMKSYIDSLAQMKHSDLPKEGLLSNENVVLLKQISGQINWIATQCHPDVAYDNCLISNSLSSASVLCTHLKS